MKKFTAYVWAFLTLIAVFFTAGMFTLGSPVNTGKALLVKADETAYYSLETKSGEKLDAVYVNIGAIYTEVGEKTTLTVKSSSSASPASSSATSSWSSGFKTEIANIYTDTDSTAKSGANYNWLCVGSGLSKTARTIALTFTESVELNELVCLNEEGERIALEGYNGVSSDNNYTKKALGFACDAQKSFTTSGNSFYNFTPEEGYYMTSVHNLLGGNTIEEDSEYVLDSNYNYLATVLFTPTVAAFGNSTFALRLPAFLATCVLIVFAYLLVRELVKSDKYAFLFAAILCVGGMVTTVGRLGAPYVFIASAIVASAYFMYRFYAKGISSKRVIKDGMNVFISGVFAAFAMAIDITSVFPVIGILVLFGFGLRRQKLARKLALEKVADEAEEVEDENGEITIVNKASDRVRMQFAEKDRMAYGFAALGFCMTTAILLLLSAVVCYTAYLRMNGGIDDGFLVMVWQGVVNSVRSNGALPFGSANWSSIWAWWLPWRAATVYTGVNGAGAGNYLAWNVAPNLVATCLSLLAVIGVTVKVALDFVRKATDKKALRLRRGYFVLLGGMAAAMLAGALKAQVSPLYALTFHTLYLGFLPLAATLLPEGDAMKKNVKLIVEVAIWAVVALCAVMFVLSVPSAYGLTVTAEYAKSFGWTTFVSNGYFR